MAARSSWAAPLRALTATRPRRRNNRGPTPESVSLFRFFEWLGNTSWSVAFHESRYVFLLVLMIHVLTLSVFVGTALMIDLRLLGKTMTHVPVSQVVTRLMPWAEAGFAVMVVTGALLFYAAPVARYENIFFRFKMAALAMAAVNVWIFRRRINRG